MTNKSKNAKKTQKNTGRSKTSSASASKGTVLKGMKQPSMSASQDGSFTVSHSEYMMDITGTSSATAQAIAINPQRGEAFTWLSALATRFEMYRFNKLKFSYKPSCSTSTDGFIVLGFDFDAYDPIPTKSSMLAWKYSQKSSPWQEMNLNVSQDSRLSTFRYADYSDRGDKRLDVLGQLFYIADAGTSKFFGELFVEYSITFRQPSYQVPPSLSAAITSPAWGSFNEWFKTASGENIVKEAGNILFSIIDKDSALIRDVGQYFITATAVASSGFTGTPVMTAQIPTESPSANFSFLPNDSIVSSVAGVASYILDVVVPPVLLSAGGVTGGTDLRSTIKIATYDNRKLFGF